MKIAALLFTLICPAILHADIIHLYDGSTLEGDVKRNNDQWTVTTPTGQVINLLPMDVKSIEVKSSTKPTTSAREGLNSLRRSAENVSDLKQVIARYEQFIARLSQPDVAEDARTDLALWKQRLEQGLVKAGGKWVTPQQRLQMADHSAQIVGQAKLLVLQSRFKEAEAILQQALSEDPQNAAAWYLRGLMLYQQDQAQQSRQCFEAVNNLVPNFSAGINNLAVVLWRQKQYASALYQFDQAMTSAAPVQTVLNNVAEALNLLSQQPSPPRNLANVAKHFEQYDKQMQARLAGVGLFRWGATWVTREELDKLKAAEKEIQGKLNVIKAEFNKVRSRLTEIESRMRLNENLLDDLQGNSWWRDSKGNLVRMPLPDSYYTILRDQDRLSAERRELKTRLEDIRKEGKAIEKTLPKPPYSGLLQMIGPEATPVREGSEPPPTTQPKQ